MSKNTKTFFIGMLVMMMILRPEIGSAVMRSFADGVENVTKVAFQRDKPVEVVEKKPDETTVTILTLLERIIDKLDAFGKPKEPVEEIITEEKVKEEVTKTDYSITNIRAQYDKELEMQKFLEKREQYSGTDPIVRSRLRLDDKLPPFEEYKDKKLMTEKQFDKEFAAKFGE